MTLVWAACTRRVILESKSFVFFSTGSAFRRRKSIKLLFEVPVWNFLPWVSAFARPALLPLYWSISQPDACQSPGWAVNLETTFCPFWQSVWSRHIRWRGRWRTWTVCCEKRKKNHCWCSVMFEQALSAACLSSPWIFSLISAIVVAPAPWLPATERNTSTPKGTHAPKCLHHHWNMIFTWGKKGGQTD